MDSEMKFRTSAMGYNKNDVNNYIEQITEEYQNKIKEKDDELVKLRNQMKEYKTQLDETSKGTEDRTEDKTKIADVLIKAQATAENIIEEAKKAAIEEKRKIEEAIEQDREKLVDLKAELKKLRTSVEETLTAFHTDLNSFVKDDKE